MEIYSTSNTVFKLASSAYRYKTGRINNDGLVLVGQLRALTAIYFDKLGTCVAFEQKVIGTRDANFAHENLAQDEDMSFIEDPLLEQWRNDLGFEEEVISVREFRIEQIGVKLVQYPYEFREFLANPEHPTMSPERRQELEKLVQAWKDDEFHVLVWGDELWIDKDGEIDST